MAWILRQTGVSSPIVGTTKAKHLDDAVAALQITLENERMSFTGRILRPTSSIGTPVSLDVRQHF